MSIILCFFFFFKQKTAYEMRISDWSSDVCSSDLEDRLNPARSIEKIIPLDGRDNRQVGDGARHIFCIVECRCAGVRGLDDLERWLNFGEQATERGDQK